MLFKKDQLKDVKFIYSEIDGKEIEAVNYKLKGDSESFNFDKYL